MAFRVVAFDFDGTLVQSNKIKADGLVAVASALPGGADAMAVLQREAGRANRYQLFDRLVENLELPDDDRLSVSRELALRYGGICHAEISNATEVPGAEAALRSLSARGLELYICSATPTEPLIEIIEARGWSGFFEGIYGSPATKVDHTTEILSRGGWNPEEMLFVGDSDDDAIAAENTGCHFLGICLAGGDPRFSEQPRHWMATLESLPEFVANAEFSKQHWSRGFE